MSSALLLVRIILGGFLIAHGTQKLFGWFGGYGLAGTGSFLESLGFRPGRRYALAAGLCEAVGGLLVVLGFLGPIGPALIVVAMLTAMGSVHWKNGFFVTSNGVEMVLAWATLAVALAFTGPGVYSLDALFGIALGRAWPAWVAILAAVVVALANLTVRRPQPTAHAGAQPG